MEYKKGKMEYKKGKKTLKHKCVKSAQPVLLFLQLNVL